MIENHNLVSFRMALRTVVAGSAIALMVAACSTATPYKAAPSEGSGATGYSSQRLDANHFRVSFAGNRLTARGTVENYLLYRAAELTVENGYDGFTLIERDTERRTETRVERVGLGAYGYWGPRWRYYRGGFGWYDWSPYYGDPFWSDRVNIQTVDRYEAFAEIAMFRGQQPDDSKAFNAREVLENLRSTIEFPD